MPSGKEAPLIALQAGSLIDGNGNHRTGGVSLLVEGDRIRSIGARDAEIPAGARVIDLGDRTLMPGLIDCHMHTNEFNGLTFENYRWARFETSPQLQMLYGVFHAQICLEMGFTTLRDMGGMNYSGLNVNEIVAMREAFDGGILPGPRLVVAAWTTISGSHLDMVFPYSFPRAPEAMADGVDELRKLARSNIRKGADWIKTCLSGGAGVDREELTVRNMTQEEVDAVVEEAHAFRKACAAHCHTPESQKVAMNAGVDTLEHCVLTDDEAIEMMVERGIYLIPTLAHRTDRAIELRRRSGTPQFVLDKMQAIQETTYETFQRLREAGVKIAMGSDVQLDPEMGANAIELEVYVQLGMSPMEAITTATRNAAEALRLDDELGTLEAGKLADLIAVDGDPLDDITTLQDRERIGMVMKGGQIFSSRIQGMERKLISDHDWNERLDAALGGPQGEAIARERVNA